MIQLVLSAATTETDHSPTTTTITLHIASPHLAALQSAQRMIQLVLSAATTETDNPDLRDRAYVYWRLLSTDPEVCVAKDKGACLWLC